MWPEPQLEDLYREVILDHYKSPRNRGTVPDPDIVAEGMNPLCGDEVEITLCLNDGTIQAVRFQGVGCSISQASASMMTEEIRGKSLAEAEHLVAAFKGMMQGDHSVALEELGDLEALQGVRRFPVRVKCATLAWNALQQGIEEYKAKRS